MNRIPNIASHIINTITAAGYEAYLVGGCVRDYILNKNIHDIDITTSARPDVILSLFDKAVYTGKKYGTVSVYYDNDVAEVTTYRTEYGYTDFRRPDIVTFASSLIEDVKRRDFTINAICMDESQIIDYFNGISDIKQRIIRCIGIPDERFYEDPLRILRAFRFAATLGFEIDKDTFKSAINNSKLLKELSVERLRDELIKICMSGKMSVLSPLLKSGQLEFLNLYYNDQIDANYILSSDCYVNFILFLYLCGKDSLNYLKLSNDNKKTINETFRIIECFPKKSKEEIKTILNRFSYKSFIYACDILKSIYQVDVSLYIDICNEIVENNEPYSVRQLDINGYDLMSIGIYNKDIGDIMNELLKIVIKNPNMNKKNILKIEASKITNLNKYAPKNL